MVWFGHVRLPQHAAGMSPTLMRLGINLWPPFLFTGIHVSTISPDWRRARVELRMRPWNRNYVGTHFGGSLFAMTDPFWMLLVMQRLGPDYFVWDKAAEIEFVKPGRGRVHADFVLDDATLELITERTADGRKYLHWFENEVRDHVGDVVARVRKQVYVRHKPDRRPAGAQGVAPG
jgi:acyl-coenzyme A thioesterase PaaI-like protein